MVIGLGEERESRGRLCSAVAVRPFKLQTLDGDRSESTANRQTFSPALGPGAAPCPFVQCPPACCWGLERTLAPRFTAIQDDTTWNRVMLFLLSPLTRQWHQAKPVCHARYETEQLSWWPELRAQPLASFLKEHPQTTTFGLTSAEADGCIYKRLSNTVSCHPSSV